MSLKIEVVHVDIQTLTVVDVKPLFGVLKQESRFSDATCSLDTNHAVVPVNLIHQGATNGRIDMFHEVAMCTKKCFHQIRVCFKNACKGSK